MSKRAKALKKQQRMAEKKAHGRNHQRHIRYGKFATTADSTPPSTNGEPAHSGKTNGRFSKTGQTKAQKNRLGKGKPAEGHAASYGSRTTRSTLGSTSFFGGGWRF
jgi:hypothetical protein